VDWEKMPLRSGSTRLFAEPRVHCELEGACVEVDVMEDARPSALEAGDKEEELAPLLEWAERRPKVLL